MQSDNSILRWIRKRARFELIIGMEELEVKKVGGPNFCRPRDTSLTSPREVLSEISNLHFVKKNDFQDDCSDHPDGENVFKEQLLIFLALMIF